METKKYPVPGIRYPGCLAGYRLPVTPYRICLIVALALTTAAFAADELPRPNKENPVVVHADAQPREVTIGDPIRYTVEISTTPDAEVIVPVLAGAMGEFEISDFGQLPVQEKDGTKSLTWWYTLKTFETGDRLIPKFKVPYRPAGEGLKEAESNEVLIGVASLLARHPDADDIRDVKPPEKLPIDWTPYLLVGGIVLAILLLALGFYFLINRPRRQRIIPPRPAHEVALDQLNRLRAQNLVQAGEFEKYYVGLSSIVRSYLENGFRLRAPEMTTEEFLATAAEAERLNSQHRRLLGEFLSQADLVKFARVVPTVRDSEAAYDAARRFVDETRPGAMESKPEVTRAAA
jgi:hypothetical protein